MQNPLLKIQFEIPFDRIKAEHVEPAIQQLIEESKAGQQSLGASQPPRTFENTMLALEEVTDTLDWAMGVVRHMESVATYEQFRAAHNAVQAPVAEYYSQIPLDANLWKVLREYSETDDAKTLSGIRRRFLDKTLDSFRRHGAELDDAGKKKLNEIDIELTQLTTKFSEHVLDATNDFELLITDETKLAGLPESALEAAKAGAQAKKQEGWRFTLQAPSYIAVMTYLADSSIRRQMWEAFNHRGATAKFDNRPLIARILELRKAKAELLGFKNFADFVLYDRMAHTGEDALIFVRRLHEKTVAQFERENQDLYKFRKSIEGDNAPPLEPWDVGYYSEKQREALYDFDEEALRPYFPLDNVVDGMFQIVNRLYGVKVVETTGVPVWDPSVKTYRLEDNDGSHLGSFYADWFPRENKRGGAWMDAFLTGAPDLEGWRPHLGLICGNLTPPVGDKPALLTHREVETIFHEFGHLLHHLLSRVEIRSLAGTNVAWDFVELPSQIMENWCWERDAIDLFARHYQTGALVPEDLFQKMKRARTFRAANAQMRQLGFGTVDLQLHIEYKQDDGDVLNYANRILAKFAPAPLPKDYGMLAAFTHLFASPVGYGAGYYSYKWAEVLDADAFTRFREEGIFSPEVGQAFRGAILSKGNSEDPAELYRSFMGRDPDEAALLVRSGLVS